MTYSIHKFSLRAIRVDQISGTTLFTWPGVYQNQAYAAGTIKYSDPVIILSVLAFPLKMIKYSNPLITAPLVSGE